MGLKERAEIAVGGPDGQGTWGDEGDSFTLQNHGVITTSTTASVFPAQTITRADTVLQDGSSPAPDSLPLGARIQSWKGIQCSNGNTAQAANNTITLYFRLARNLGLAVALAAGTAITQITVPFPLVSAIPSGATLRFRNPSGNTFTATTSALAAVGSTVIPVTSVTPANAYPTGTPGVVNGTSVMILVGGLGDVAGTTGVNTNANSDAIWGWVGTGAGTTGTPDFPAGATVITPLVAGNTAAINGVVPVCMSDNLQTVVASQAGTPTQQILNCQPLLV